MKKYLSMKKINISIPSIIVGLFLGAWIMYFLIRGIIFQEFSGLEMVGNDSYIGLRNELLDDLLLLPTFFLVPATFIVGIGLVIWGWVKNKK